MSYIENLSVVQVRAVFNILYYNLFFMEGQKIPCKSVTSHKLFMYITVSIIKV